MNTKALIVKSNNLVEAFSDMTTNEAKIIAFLISKIRKEDNDFNIQGITVKEFNELLNIKGTKTYSYMKVFAKELLKKTVEVLFDNGDILNVNWFQYSKYINATSTLELCFNSYLKEHLLILKNNYTKYLLENICCLSSPYTIKLYEILKQYQKIGYRILGVDDLKYILGIKDMYKLYADFKKRVLIPSQSEINFKTDIEFEFIEIKRGKSVIEIKFIIRVNKNIEENQIATCGEKNIKSIEEKNITEYKEIQKLISDFNYKYNGNLDYNLIKNLIKLKGIDCVKTCVIEFADFVDNANKVESAFYDFAKKYGTSSAYTKGNVYRNMIGNKPIQATNYEQREYDDEFFDKLYVNYEFVKDELNNKKKM